MRRAIQKTGYMRTQKETNYQQPSNQTKSLKNIRGGKENEEIRSQAHALDGGTAHGHAHALDGGTAR